MLYHGSWIFHYKIKSGDNISEIVSRNLNRSIETVRVMNLTRPHFCIDLIYPGELLMIVPIEFNQEGLNRRKQERRNGDCIVPGGRRNRKDRRKY